MKKTLNKVKKQSEFCWELMDRLDNDIRGSKVQYGTIEKYTQMVQDVIRLRRELITLRNMLMEWGYES